MKVLLDAHTLIWSVDDVGKITTTAMTAMRHPGGDLLVSASSVWEIAIKVGKGKVPLSLPFRACIDKALATLGLACLPIPGDPAKRLTDWRFTTATRSTG